MARQPQLLSADDVLDLPLPDGIEGYEFIDGEPVPVMAASPVHGELIVAVAARLYEHVRKMQLPGKVYSDAGFVLGLRRDRERMRAPDIPRQ